MFLILQGNYALELIILLPVGDLKWLGDLKYNVKMFALNDMNIGLFIGLFIEI